MAAVGNAGETKFFFDDDADLSLIEGKTLAILGYGNQGRSQALNLRDHNINVIIGAPRDRSARQAAEDGFPVATVPEAVAQADILMLLIPDEILPAVWDRDIAPNLKDGAVLSFAHGYNITFGYVEPPASCDVVLVAPRMIGQGVRDTFVRGDGFPSVVAVAQDASGKALDNALAIAKGIGSTRMGAILTTFDEETQLDLYMEQIGSVYNLRASFEVLTESGFTPEIVLLELYASGETAEIYQASKEIGLIHQMKLHSRTSQYGQQVTSQMFQDTEARKESLRKVIQHIKSGDFAREWEAEQAAGAPRLIEKTNENLQHPMQEAENRLFRILGRRDYDLTSAVWLQGEDESEAAPASSTGTSA
jgi:ketol-acid reductoisomerase